MRVKALFVICCMCLIGNSIVAQKTSSKDLAFHEQHILNSILIQQSSSQNKQVSFITLLDSIHFNLYYYDSLGGLISSDNTWDYFKYSTYGDLSHHYKSTFPNFGSATRNSYKYDKTVYLKTEREYQTPVGLPIQSYPNEWIIDAILTPSAKAREDVYSNPVSGKKDSIIEWKFNSPVDSFPYRKESYLYNSAFQISYFSEMKNMDIGKGLKWYLDKNESNYYDSKGRDTLYLLNNRKTSVDSVVTPDKKVHTVFYDSLGMGIRLYYTYEMVDKVFVLNEMDTITFDSIGTINACTKYKFNVITQQWEFDVLEHFKLVSFGLKDTVMQIQVVGQDTVYGDYFSYVFNIHNQLVSVIGWSKDIDLEVLYKRIEYKYVYNTDGTLGHILNYSYPIAYVNTLLLDGHYQFYYSIHTVNIDDPEITKKDEKILVFPNPSTGVLNYSTEMDKEAELTIINTHGQKVYCEKVYANQGSVDLNALPTGMYFIRFVKDSKLVYSQKWLKIEE